MSFMTWVAATLSCVLLLVADVRFHSSCEERAAYVQTSLDLVGPACAKDACSADCAAAHATAWRKATFMVSEWRGALGEGRRRCVRTGKLGIQKKCHVVWPPPERAWPDAHAAFFSCHCHSSPPPERHHHGLVRRGWPDVYQAFVGAAWPLWQD